MFLFIYIYLTKKNYYIFESTSQKFNLENYILKIEVKFLINEVLL